MLRLPLLEAVRPRTVEEVVEALAQAPGQLVAGGTDALPNLKHGLGTLRRVVQLSAVPELRGLVWSDREVSIGARTTLAELAIDGRIGEAFPSLRAAAGAVASPIIRNLATLGGNINLDTRCRYVNQSEFWRGALGGCLKAEGEVCHVVPNGRRCVAAMSSDCVPALLSLDARMELAGPGGRRQLPLAEYYCADGVRHIKRAPDELVTRVIVPLPTGPTRSAYVKWAVRKSIDYPLVSVALRFGIDRDGPDARVQSARVVAGVLAATPREVGGLDKVVGMKLNDPAVAQIVSEQAFRQCKPVANVPYSPAHRRRLIGVLTRRAVVELGR